MATKWRKDCLQIGTNPITSKADPVVNQIIAKASQSTMSQHFDLDDCFHLSLEQPPPSLPSCCKGRTQLGLMHIKTSKYAHHHHHYCRQQKSRNNTPNNHFTFGDLQLIWKMQKPLLILYCDWLVIGYDDFLGSHLVDGGWVLLHQINYFNRDKQN